MYKLWTVAKFTINGEVDELPMLTVSSNSASLYPNSLFTLLSDHLINTLSPDILESVILPVMYENEAVKTFENEAMLFKVATRSSMS